MAVIPGGSCAGGRLDSILAGGGAAQADHRDAKGHVGPLGGTSPGGFQGDFQGDLWWFSGV